LLYSKQDSSQITRNSYLFKQQLRQIEQLEKSKIKFVPKEELTVDPRIIQLVDHENEIKNPTGESFDGLSVSLNRKQEKKLRNKISKLEISLKQNMSESELNKAKQNVIQWKARKSENYRIDQAIKSLSTDLINKYNQCINELYDLEYLLSKEGELSPRGLIASQISNANEILLTELIIDGCLNQLDLPSLASVLSIFCDDARTDAVSEIELPEQAREIIDMMFNLREDLREFSVFEEVLSEKDITDSFCQLAYLWAKGMSYLEIFPYLSELFEGNKFGGRFVKNMLRITNICDEITKICEVYPDPVLEKKVDELKTTMLREVVTFDSLHLH
jgi:superfamily II RNA helicase